MDSWVGFSSAHNRVTFHKGKKDRFGMSIPIITFNDLPNGSSIGGDTLFAIWRAIPAQVSGLAFCYSRPQADI
ncbi:hypothetical protein [Methylacidiphilum caldifontis]|uniref:hypothetical protein n=1 Tax=Methylacidiphilum caldifontis TaxID=2795386 RepID=UPI00106DA52A|nr:hypothetical protein [Methylacidiphilum caldifontis]